MTYATHKEMLNNIKTRREIVRTVLTRQTLQIPLGDYNHSGLVSKSYWRKRIVYGSFSDVYEYFSPIIAFYTKDNAPSKPPLDKTKQQKRSSFSVNRARQNIYRIAQANAKPQSQFLTFTFAENILELKTAHEHWNYFIKKYNKKYSMRLQYLVVPEFQKRGAVHYHALFFNPHPITKSILEKMWSHGFVDVDIPRDIKNVSAYISKYLGKNIEAEKRMLGQKAYFTSRNVIRPIEIYDDEAIDIFLQSANIEMLAVVSAKHFNLTKYKHEH